MIQAILDPSLSLILYMVSNCRMLRAVNDADEPAADR